MMLNEVLPPLVTVAMLSLSHRTNHHKVTEEAAAQLVLISTSRYTML